MEIKKGMYVSTVDRKEIGKITHFCDCEYCKERGYFEPIIDNPNMFITIVDKRNSFHGYKFYDDILDLIEPGDYINGYYVEDITSIYDDGKEIKTLHLATGSNHFQPSINDSKSIKTILTKEQFAAMAYEVK